MTLYAAFAYTEPLIDIRMSQRRQKCLRSMNANRVSCLRDDLHSIYDHLLSCKYQINQTYPFQPIPLFQEQDLASNQSSPATALHFKIIKHFPNLLTLSLEGLEQTYSLFGLSLTSTNRSACFLSEQTSIPPISQENRPIPLTIVIRKLGKSTEGGQPKSKPLRAVNSSKR